MKAHKILIALSLLAVVGLTSCRDKFAELNSDPTAVTVAEPSYLATTAMMVFEANDYTYWFYNAPLYSRWSQMASPGSYSEASYGMGAINWQNNYISMLVYRNEILKYVETAVHPEMAAYYAMCGTLAVYGAIYASDINGDIQYTEAAQFTQGGTLTPNYDSVEDLYDILIDDLDTYIAIFQDETQVVVGSQDIIYNGSVEKWAKLANSLKLKIAVRLYNNNSTKASQIAKDVIDSPVGYLNSLDESFIYHKADARIGDSINHVMGDLDAGDAAYQTGNDISMSGASANVIDFMKAGKDPRVRFFYTKNAYNSEIIKEFIKENKYDDLPTFVKENIVLDGEGKFVSWKEGQELWARYQGTPVALYGSAEYNKYKDEIFEPGNVRYQLVIGDANKSYGSGRSSLSQEMIRGRVDFTLPTIPGGKVIQDTEDVPWWGMYMGSGETNLYLAELAALGAISGNPKAYYERGVELSVAEWDFIAGKNKIPYYGEDWVDGHKYAEEEVSIELKAGEIATMLATDAVKWDGSIEKIYLQQLMNFTMMPNDQFVTARRSGYPKIGSDLLPFVKFDGIALEAIPRRFEFSTPQPTDIMYEIRVQNLKDQGITPGSNQSGMGFATSTVLNTERLWQDKNAPQWGSAK
jgi:hypothetical protein